MTNAEFESLLNRAQAAMVGMQAAEIEASEAQMKACIGQALAPSSQRHLSRLRALALQSAQLWHACLPQDNAAISYSREGLVDVPARGIELSITG